MTDSPLRERPRIVSWFSCGTASAVATKLVIARYAASHDIAVARCLVAEEHPDNDRFAAECEQWFGVPVIGLRSVEYASCEDVWTRTRYMAGPDGARCTVEMKKAVRWAFEAQWKPDLQAFGYTIDEGNRAGHFRTHNPDVALITPLIEAGLRKEDCHAIVDRAGIVLPMMYRLGFNNANCIGCVQAQSPGYWNRVRRHFPEVFNQRAALSRSLNVRLVKLTTGERTRLFLDELDQNEDRALADPPMDCSLLCYMAEQDIAR